MNNFSRYMYMSLFDCNTDFHFVQYKVGMLNLEFLILSSNQTNDRTLSQEDKKIWKMQKALHSTIY